MGFGFLGQRESIGLARLFHGQKKEESVEDCSLVFVVDYLEEKE